MPIREILKNESIQQQHNLCKAEMELATRKNELEVLSFELKRKEQLLAQQEKEIERESLKSQITKEGLKPFNEMYQSEKDRLTRLKEEISRQEEDLLNRESVISRREVELRKREIYVEQILYHDIEDEKERIRCKERQCAEYERAIQRNFEILEKEKNKIYKCSLEMKRQYDVIQLGYRKWKKYLRSIKLSGSRGFQLHDDYSDGVNIPEIDEDIDWGDLVEEIREDVRLLEMGPNDDQDDRMVIKASHKASQYESQKKITAHPTAENYLPTNDEEEILSIADGPRQRGDDSLEYSLISTSPAGNQIATINLEKENYLFNRERKSSHGYPTILPPSTSKPEIGIMYPPPIPPMENTLKHRLSSESKPESSPSSSNLITTTIDLHLTTEHMRNIAMKYHAL